MPKKGGKKSKGLSFAAPSHCVNVFGVAPGALLVTPAGCEVKVVGMGDKDENLYALFPGNYTTALGDADGTPLADCEGLLRAGYSMNRRYICEMVHIIDGKRVFDPKVPLEHEVTEFASSSEMTSKLLNELFSAAHVPAQQLQDLSLLSGVRVCMRGRVHKRGRERARMRERESEREREREKARARESESERARERERARARESECKRVRERESERERELESESESKTEQERERARARESENEREQDRERESKSEREREREREKDKERERHRET